MINTIVNQRLLILCTTTGYQTQAFVEAAQKLGLEITLASDRCHVLEDPWRDGALPLRFEEPEESARQIVNYARSNVVDAIVSLGDRPTPTAAWACHGLGLPYHSVEAADICRDKYRSRECLRAAGLKVPSFARFPLEAEPRAIVVSPRNIKDCVTEFTKTPSSPRAPSHRVLEASESGATKARGVRFPCVLKPLALSGSRGVIRADNCEEFVTAFERIRTLLRSPEVRVMREDTSHFIHVEEYVEGEEIAVEALVDRGEPRVLAIFDKPDPLIGPFFEETIYVTPSRLAPGVQAEVATALESAAQALGLFHGPVHAEFRINPRGLWVLEVAARSIGGLCSRALRFCSHRLGDEVSLEEVIVRLALGEEVRSLRREPAASGVMMVPIPEAGIYQGVEGLEQALETPGLEDIRITARPTQKLVPLPEGASYLGFIFARGRSPEFVEEALRKAHQKLRFVISPALPVV